MFWKKNPLEMLNRAEWELLCDGCARCCLQKLEYEDSGEIVYTRIACRYLDAERCRCTEYDERVRLMPTCCRLTPENLADIYFMPATCAYRVLAEGGELPCWHPLVSGSPDSAHTSGMSVRGKVLSETDVPADDWEAHVIDWVK